ncbi:MAG: hypothetical protein WCY19_05865 [Candidatus Gastranaerophilaceae bacterium]
MSNVISSAIFCARNVDKAEKQDKIGRWAVAAGQAKKVVDYVSTLDNEVGKGARTAVNALKTYSESEKLLSYAGKAIDFASRKVNPLICVSSGIDILRADDKDSALIKNAAALSSMFAVEHLMKNHLDDIPKIKGIDKIAERVMKFAAKYKIEGKLPAIIHGVAFVVGSCTAYSLGDKFGTMVAGEVNGKQ